MKSTTNLLQHLILLLFFLNINKDNSAQNYTSYFTGNSTDAVTSPKGGVCLMGGATEDDNAMIWFLEQANGGDVLVLRTSGADGYNTYLYTDLGVTVNSVETIVCNNALASTETYLLQKIQQAEAIWFAGGDQWTYIDYWRNTAVDSLINQGIKNRKIVIGGTSAGMAIQGKYYFSAEFGTVTSSTALTNPYGPTVTVDSNTFIKNNFLQKVITDTHFDSPDRKGRLTTFLARIYTDYGVNGQAIACDEYTAVCIDTNGTAKVFGGYPTYDDNAYFVQVNCELADATPEMCTSGTALTWDKGGEALKAYQIKGTSTGTNTFNLNDWETGTGGTWKTWSANAGIFLEQNSTPINCTTLGVEENNTVAFSVYPNPANDLINVEINSAQAIEKIMVHDLTGKRCAVKTIESNNFSHTIGLSELNYGTYLLTVTSTNGYTYTHLIVKQ